MTEFIRSSVPQEPYSFYKCADVLPLGQKTFGSKYAGNQLNYTNNSYCNQTVYSSYQKRAKQYLQYCNYKTGEINLCQVTSKLQMLLLQEKQGKSNYQYTFFYSI